MKKIYIVFFVFAWALGANAQLNSSLVAHYPFNNSLNDASGNGYHLTGYGHLFGYDRNGTINECMYFDSTATSGKDSVVGITQLNDQEMTISFWIKADTNYWNSTKIINTGYSVASDKYTWSLELRNGFSSDTGGAFNKKTRSLDSSSIDFYAYHTNFTDYATATIGVPNNQWAFVTLTYKAGDSIRAYINGIKNQSYFSNHEFPFSSLAGITDKISFGHQSSSYFNQLTQLDEFKIYNKKATDAEVMQLYASYPLGISLMKAANEISIFPNPVKNTLGFSLDELNNNATACIFSIDGKLITSQSIESLQAIINTESLTKGMYVLHIKNGGQSLTSKFIKE